MTTIDDYPNISQSSNGCKPKSPVDDFSPTFLRGRRLALGRSLRGLRGLGSAEGLRGAAAGGGGAYPARAEEGGKSRDFGGFPGILEGIYKVL